VEGNSLVFAKNKKFRKEKPQIDSGVSYLLIFGRILEVICLRCVDPSGPGKSFRSSYFLVLASLKPLLLLG